jgi:hypothetical protein
MTEGERRRDAVTVAHAWVAAVNAVDADGLAALSAADIEIVGPRGSVRGVDVLREWLLRAGIALETTRTFAGVSDVVLAHRATWQTPGTATPSSADVASWFQIQEGRVARYQRFDDLQSAIAASGLEPTDEITSRANHSGMDLV